jgi:hypothetical protein
VKTKDGHETKNDLKFAISKHHASTMKEEFEQVDEVSKKTLSNYIRKASTDAANHAYTAGGVMFAGQAGYKMGDKGDAINKDAYHALAVKRLKGISKAAQKMSKEEVEQIDELSDALKKRYIKKANKQVDKAENIILNPSNRIYRGAERGNPNAENKYAKADITYHKRLNGIEKAKATMKNEEVEFSAEELARIEAIEKNFDEGIIKKKSDVNEVDMPRLPRVPDSEFPVRLPRVPDSEFPAPVNTGSSPAPNVPNASDKPKISAPALKNETIAKSLK